MTGSGDVGATLRGKTLHTKMAHRVMSRYASEHYDDAVLAAFRVIEETLRDALGKSDAPMKDLLHQGFNPATGTLQDPKAWQSEREGIFLLFKSAFQAFRDRRAHEFVSTDAEEAFDLIVLANRMLLIVEDRHRSSRLGSSISYAVDPEKLRPLLGTLTGEETEPVFLDADGDGELELLGPGRGEGEVFVVSKVVEGLNREVEVERRDRNNNSVLMNVMTADVDNDGRPEVVCTVAAGNQPWALMFYKHRYGRYAILKSIPQFDGREWYMEELWLRAHIADVNGDGEIEVVSEPKTGGAMPPPVRYFWKWNGNEGGFELLYEEESPYRFPTEGRK